jgi:hypothetical protein
LVDHLAVLDVLGVQRLVAVPIADAFAARLIGSFEELHEAPGARGSSCARTVTSSSSTCVSMHSMSQKTYSLAPDNRTNFPDEPRSLFHESSSFADRLYVLAYQTHGK